jgi:hypothetical protein
MPANAEPMSMTGVTVLLPGTLRLTRTGPPAGRA